FAASTWQDADSGSKRNARPSKLGPLAANARKRRAEHLRNRHAHERRRNVRPIVYVLLERESLAGRPAPISNQSHRIDLKQQRRFAFILISACIENMRAAEAQFKRL